MMNKDDRDLTEKLTNVELKLRAYIACVWGAIILFAMVGTVLGKPAGTMVALIAALMWVELRILGEALAGLHVLRHMKKKSGGTSAGSDGDPPAA